MMGGKGRPPPADAGPALLGPEALGPGGGQAARQEAGKGGAGAQACGSSPPHGGGWYGLPLGPGGRCGVAPRGGAVWSGARSALLPRGPVAGTREAVKPYVVS